MFPLKQEEAVLQLRQKMKYNILILKAAIFFVFFEAYGPPDKNGTYFLNLIIIRIRPGNVLSS